MSVPLRSDDPAFLERYAERIAVVGDCYVWTDGSNGNGYRRICIDGRMFYVHRLSFVDAYGEIPDGMVVDHICYNTSCVNPRHLRLATRQQNIANKSGLAKNNQSGLRGVSWHKRKQKWQARVQVEGRSKYLGYFDDKNEAGRVVEEARQAFFGAFAGRGK